MDCPAGVKQGVLAIWASLAISALGAVASFRLGYASEGEFIFGLLFYAVLCVIPYKISVGSNPARYVYVILCCLSALLVLADGDAGMKKPDVIAAVLGVPFTIFSIFRLFQAPANTWFSAGRAPAGARR